jgi:hypothetical protein
MASPERFSTTPRKGDQRGDARDRGRLGGGGAVVGGVLRGLLLAVPCGSTWLLVPIYAGLLTLVTALSET